MTLFILDNAHKGTIQSLLQQIVNNDPALSVATAATSAGGMGLMGFQITYNPKRPADKGQEIIKDLANVAGKRILIRGVGSNQTIHVQPPGKRPQSFLITQVGGGAVPDFQTTDVDVYFDAQDCTPYGYAYFDASANKVTARPYMRLFHELDHARRNINGNPGHGEVPVIAETNAFRTQRKITVLRKGHAGGCSNTAKPPGKICFIVTAASGSPQAQPIITLQTIRNSILRNNEFGRLLEGRFYSAYMQFSPQVAETVAVSEPLRRATLDLFVEPLIDFLRLAQSVAATDLSTTTIDMLTEIRKRYELRFGRAEIERLEQQMGHWAQRFRQKDTLSQPATTSSETRNAQEVLRYLYQMMSQTVPGDPYVLWPLVEPLDLFWKVLAAEDENAAAHLLVDGLSRWIESMPIPPETRQLPADVWRVSLEQLGTTILRQDNLRTPLARRLSAELQAELPFDLNLLLEETGYHAA